MAARTRKTAPAKAASVKLTPEQVAALTPAQIAALPVEMLPSASDAPTSEARLQVLGCWTASDKRKVVRGQFTHTKKDGTTADYRVLSREDAHAHLDALLDAGRLITLRVPS